MIRLDKLSKTYDGGLTYSVKEVSLEVKQGETLVLLGSSGCGKTTTLKMINRLITPSSGKIFIDGQDVSSIDPVILRRAMSYVFQSVGLFPHLNVLDNITILLRILKIPFKERQARAHELLRFVNLDPMIYSERYPDELSGGQQQRVGVARALANDPNILLMDEPFGAVDSITRDALQKDFFSLKKQLRKTVIFVTHDVIEALRLSDYIAVMDNGRIIQIGTKETLIKHPNNDFIERLFQIPAEQYALYAECLE
jgi:osmoprotectant transport system ATP-binding protein